MKLRWRPSECELAAADAPGISQVDDRLEVSGTDFYRHLPAGRHRHIEPSGIEEDDLMKTRLLVLDAPAGRA